LIFYHRNQDKVQDHLSTFRCLHQSYLRQALDYSAQRALALSQCQTQAQPSSLMELNIATHRIFAETT